MCLVNFVGFHCYTGGAERYAPYVEPIIRFGIHPPEFASIVPPESVIRGAMIPDPTHPANIEILHSALDDILTQYPGVDWVWLWLHEHSMYVSEPQLQGRFKEFHQQESGNFKEAANDHDVFTGVWSLAYIRRAHNYLAQRAPGVKLAIGGWGGGLQMPPVLLGLDRALPEDVVFSCLNSDGGVKGHIPVFKEIAAHRPVWAMPWLEFDGPLWHLQLRASSMLKQVKDAADDNLNGVVAIHWRTAKNSHGSKTIFSSRYCWTNAVARSKQLTR